MSMIHNKIILTFLFTTLLPVIGRADYCSNHELNCKQLGNIILTPKGVEKLLKEQMDVSLINQKASAEISQKLKQQKDIILFESKSNCAKELSPADFAKMQAGLKQGNPNCSYYPVLQQDGDNIKPVKFVPFRARLSHFDINPEKTKFDVSDVKCETAQYCSAKVSAQQISAGAKIIIESLDGKPLETPNLELANKRNATPASAQFDLVLKPDGKLVSSTGSFSKLELQLNKTELQSAIMDKNGKILSDEQAQNLQVQVARQKRESYFREIYKNISEAELKEEYSKYREQQKIKGLPVESFSSFAKALENWKKNPVSYPTIFNQLPGFQSVSSNAAASTKGFSTPLTESLFNGYIDTINNHFITDPKVHDIVKDHLNHALKSAEASINRGLAQISGDLGRVFVQTNNLPVADVANMIRLKSIDEQIQNFNDIIENDTASSSQKSDARNKLSLLFHQRDDLLQKLDDKKVLEVTTVPFFDKINDMNRIGIFAGGKQCPPPTKIQSEGVKDKRQLGGAEFGFELTMDSIQAYVNEMYEVNKNICLGSTKPNCDGGKKIKLAQKPKLILTKDGKYRLQINGAEIDNPIANPSVDVSVGLDINNCKKNKDESNQLCLAFKDAKIDSKSASVVIRDAFTWFGKTSDEEVRDGFAGVSEINITRMLPEAVRDSFDIKSPKVIGSQGLLVFPMNLRPQEQRVLLGKLN